MNKILQGKTFSFSFDFTLPSEDEIKKDDLGLLFHGTCVQNGKNVIIRYIANKQLIRNEQHLKLIQQIFTSLNYLHEGIVAVYDCLVDDDGIFIVREQLNGIDLQQIAFSGDYPHLRNQKYILRVCKEVCKILAVLHANKIVHCRIQPSNIFILADEFGQFDIEHPRVKLLNFEYAQVNGNQIFNFPQIPYTRYYSSPEQVLQCVKLINATTDIYCLGMTLFEAIAREHAFESEKDDDNLIYNMQVSFPLKRHHRIDKQIFPLIQKATSKHIFQTPPMRYKPEARLRFFWNAQKMRFQNAIEMQDAIEKLLMQLPDVESQSFFQKIRSLFS